MSRFCRTFSGLWSKALGVKLFKVHWSCYFDDFFVLEKPTLARHTPFTLGNLFALLGWSTSSEKNSSFDAIARALGAAFDFADTRSLSVRVSTTPHRSSEIAGPIKCILPKKEFRKSDLETLERSRESDIRLLGAQGPQGGGLVHFVTCTVQCFQIPLRETLVFLKDRVVCCKRCGILCTRRNNSPLH